MNPEKGNLCSPENTQTQQEGQSFEKALKEIIEETQNRLAAQEGELPESDRKAIEKMLTMKGGESFLGRFSAEEINGDETLSN